jgi:hypothetical protein
MKELNSLFNLIKPIKHPRLMNPKANHSNFSAIALFLFLTGVCGAQELRVTPEHSGALGGPWLPLDPTEILVEPNGAFVVLNAQTNEFFRLRIDPGRSPDFAKPLDLRDVPGRTLSIALRHLRAFSSSDRRTPGPEDDAWPEVTLGPWVHPVYEPFHRDGDSPAYLEFKVILATNPPPLTGAFLLNPPTEPSVEYGYLLVSLTEEDFPIAEFATRGPTAVEKLHRLARTRNIKPIRYGSTLLVAEDSLGRLVANWGAEPFRPSPEFIEAGLARPVWHGNDDLGTDVRPEVGALPVSHYSSYEDFKRDYTANPVYEHMRARRAKFARHEWNMENGVRLPELIVQVGQTIRIKTNEVVTAFYLDAADQEREIARVSISRTAPGLLITGVAPGAGVLMVTTASAESMYALRVIPAGGIASTESVEGFVPGWGDPVHFYAGNYADQPKYNQLEDDDWCPLVGCGPNAWAILLAWFERNWSVKAAFGNLVSLDAPPDSSGSVNKGKLRPPLNSLHDLCDVICTAFSDQGATPPGDMGEGGLGYTYIAKISGLLGRQWNIGWTLGDDCPEDGALRCRDAIKKGYPAAVGLGWLWHYAVSYGYAYQHFYFAPDTIYMTKRYLKCNMGWGNSDPRWYNLCDTFWDSDFKVWNGPNAQ